MKDYILGQLSTTCRHGHSHLLTDFVASGSEDAVTTFIVFRLADEWMQEVGKRLVVTGPMTDKSLGFRKGLKNYQVWHQRTMRDPELLRVDKADSRRFDFDPTVESDDDSN